MAKKAKEVPDDVPHCVWDHTEGLALPWLCWCGDDHPDDSGRVGADKYISPDDPGWVTATEEHLDSLYLEAMLGHEGQQ